MLSVISPKAAIITRLDQPTPAVHLAYQAHVPSLSPHCEHGHNIRNRRTGYLGHSNKQTAILGPVCRDRVHWAFTYEKINFDSEQ